MTDGKQVAQSVSQLPQGADAGVLCDRSGRGTVPSVLRQSFNGDFTLVAGRLLSSPGPQAGNPSDGSAAAFTLKPESTPVGAPPSDGFSAMPKDKAPVFQNGTSTLWYANEQGHVMSRDLGRQGAAATDHGLAHGPVFTLAGDHPWSRAPLSAGTKFVVVNPAGTVAAAGGDYNLGIWRKDAPAAGYGDEYVVPTLVGPSSTDPTMPGSADVPKQCAPKFWTDDHNLICLSAKSMHRVTFAASFDSVEKVEKLMPDTDRETNNFVLSPDAKSVAFLSPTSSAAGAPTDLYRIDLTPGAAPRKIASIPSDAPGTSSSGELRMIAWQ
ncbi:hypothetical protein ACWEQL_17885 [Kitasatospora sp. NPDC004240]